jgi:hypothetical protein
MASRFKQPSVQNELHKLLASNVSEAVRVAEALPLLLGDKLNQNVSSRFKVNEIFIYTFIFLKNNLF